MTAAAVLAEAAERLRAAGVETPEVDAELLLGHALGLTRSELQLERGREVSRARTPPQRGRSSSAAPPASRSLTFSASGGSGG